MDSRPRGNSTPPQTHAALSLSPNAPGQYVHLWRVSHDNASTALSVCGLTLPMEATWILEEATCPYCRQILNNPSRG
jgi:hypothetical protein